MKPTKKGKPFTGFKPSPHKAEPIPSKVYKKGIKPKKEKPQPEPEPLPEPVASQPEPEPMAKERPKLDAIKETVSRIAGKIRNLENAINAARSTPPDPEVAAQFDSIQRDVEEIKNAE